MRKQEHDTVFRFVKLYAPLRMKVHTCYVLSLPFMVLLVLYLQLPALLLVSTEQIWHKRHEQHQLSTAQQHCQSGNEGCGLQDVIWAATG